MQLLISANQLGTERCLLYDGTTWSWVDDMAEYNNASIAYGFESLDECDAVESLRLDVPKIRSTPWYESMTYFENNESKIPWQLCMPQWAWKSFVKNLVDCLWMNFSNPDNHYYITTLRRNRELIRSIQEPTIDATIIKSILKDSPKNSHSQIKKFMPIKDKNTAPRSRYSLSKSITGRMTISDGPNILTLKKEYRKILKSRWGDNGKIFEIDVQSVEPRVALSFFGKSVKGDVYASVMESVDIKIDRKIAKVATLSAIYGASHHSLRSILPESTNSLKILHEVKEFFGVRHIEKMIKEQHDELGYIKNSHGRKIFSEIPSVNHLIQSSAVDVSFDIFEEIISRLKNNNTKFNLIYFIHDAMIVDVNTDSIDKLMEAVNKDIYVRNVDQDFPVNIKEIC